MQLPGDKVKPLDVHVEATGDDPGEDLEVVRVKRGPDEAGQPLDHAVVAFTYGLVVRAHLLANGGLPALGDEQAVDQGAQLDVGAGLALLQFLHDDMLPVLRRSSPGQ